ncbi:MAG TPA: hypothetical protein VG756_12715 [Pseudonocardiaceae bacterium]|nr:hypothetical protein [Pseudonocardiaceae bacterium]
MAKGDTKSSRRVDPDWPGGDHPVTELASDRQGSLSPFGELSFPLPPDQVPYVHPETVINK